VISLKILKLYFEIKKKNQKLVLLWKIQIFS